MKRHLLSALAAGFLASGSAVLAQSPAAPASPPPVRHSFFDRLDTNKDGIVTRAEVVALLDRKFAAIDPDHNGVISPAEREAYRKAQRDKRFAERFAALDTDHNGQLSPAELRSGRDRHGAAGSPGFGKRHGFGGGSHHGGWGKGPRGPEAGRDGGPNQGDVTREAFSRRALALFDRVDSNHDGKITAAERDAAGSLRFPGRAGGHRGDTPKS